MNQVLESPLPLESQTSAPLPRIPAQSPGHGRHSTNICQTEKKKKTVIFHLYSLSSNCPQDCLQPNQPEIRGSQCPPMPQHCLEISEGSWARPFLSLSLPQFPQQPLDRAVGLFES